MSFVLFGFDALLMGGSWWKIEEGMGVDPFPGLDMRKPDMTAYNESRETLDRKQLQYYRVRGEMPSINEDPMMHAIAHLYASDRNGLFAVSLELLMRVMSD